MEESVAAQAPVLNEAARDLHFAAASEAETKNKLYDGLLYVGQ